MEIKETTKYNVGDVLYYVNHCNIIEKRIIEKILVVVNEDDISVRYDFGPGINSLWESHTDELCSTSLEGAANIFAQRAIDKFKKEEE